MKQKQKFSWESFVVGAVGTILAAILICGVYNGIESWVQSEAKAVAQEVVDAKVKSLHVTISMSDTSATAEVSPVVTSGGWSVAPYIIEGR